MSVVLNRANIFSKQLYPTSKLFSITFICSVLILIVEQTVLDYYFTPPQV